MPTVTDPLFYAAAFIVALGILVAVHEFGHYWVARKMGIKVLRFSIGFGKPLKTWVRGEDKTEYSIASIPLGGYVKMLDERDCEVAENELHRTYNRKPVAKRFAVVLAGPVFNFIFAILVYWLMFMLGVPGLKSVLGEVEEGTLVHEAGLYKGMRVISIGGEETPTWHALTDTLLPYALRKESVEIQAKGQGITSTYTLDFSRLQGELQPGDLQNKVGLNPYLPAELGQIKPDSPAMQAGLQQGDLIVRINDQPMDDWVAMVDTISKNANIPLTMEIERNGRRLIKEVTPMVSPDIEPERGVIGTYIPMDTLIYGPLEAAGMALYKTWDMSLLTLQMIKEMLFGRVSIENISGPITIAQAAGDSAESGFVFFLKFLAIVSLSLGVLNLLPVPLLDGGVLVLLILEAVRGRPLSEDKELMIQKVGLVLILSLMSVAMVNDINRLMAG